MADLDNIISVAEACEILGVTPARVNQFLRDGRIKAKKLGRDWAIDRASVEALAEQDRPTGRPKGT